MMNLLKEKKGLLPREPFIWRTAMTAPGFWGRAKEAMAALGRRAGAM